ncbi:MAG TPA: type II secretion system F family protein [Vicinamibacterales bacterium]|nr:type II secretion system F family protein [Vicinamibacterales bacterium]
MGVALFVFLFVVALVMGTYAAIAYLPGMMAAREMDRRLRDVGAPAIDPLPDAQSILREEVSGPLPMIDRLVAQSGAGDGLVRLIERSGVKATPSGVVVASLALAMAGALVAAMLTPQVFVRPVAAVAGLLLPLMFLKYRAAKRIKRFEEQFPEALDLLARAIRAGHAFQTSMGMVADEMPDPVGPEFKKAFDQQNFGLPLKEALNQLADRIALLDVRFFVTAVTIQRETGGNLAEILDNLAHVVRERFKILRQVRVHTAHGRFTGYVLLALPAALAVGLTYINPDFMGPLFRERMGQLMIVGGLVLQTIGFFWIRQVIKIEV